MVSLGEIAFWSLEGGDALSCPEGNDVLGTHDTHVRTAWHALPRHPHSYRLYGHTSVFVEKKESVKPFSRAELL